MFTLNYVSNPFKVLSVFGLVFIGLCAGLPLTGNEGLGQNYSIYQIKSDFFLSVQKALNLGPNLKVYDVEMEFHFLYD